MRPWYIAARAGKCSASRAASKPQGFNANKQWPAKQKKAHNLDVLLVYITMEINLVSQLKLSFKPEG